MFKFVMIAAAALSLAACNTTQAERVASVEKRSKELIRIVCAQSGETIFDEKIIEVFVISGSVHGYTADGAEFSVSGAACKWKAIPNVGTN